MPTQYMRLFFLKGIGNLDQIRVMRNGANLLGNYFSVSPEIGSVTAC